ncbi:MAG: hypothetical protein PQJ60_05360 [Spirochaetales bacterium]|nr:hypothetical protein [Spirochaetales bacterium]
MKRNIPLHSLLFALFLIAPLYGEETLSLSYHEDWLQGEVVFDISVALPTGEMKPTNRFVAEQTIESEAPGLITDALRGLVVDSWDSIGSLCYGDTHFYGELEQLISGQNKVFSKTTPDMKEFTIRYKLPFFPDLISLFLAHDRPVTPDHLTSMGRTEEEFTGLVIYAGDPAPYHGTKENNLLEPALFPTFYDEEMKLIFDKTYIEPEALKNWGMVQYSVNVPEDFLEIRERVGMKPLKISLREVYGKNGCDLILSRKDGQQILSSTEISDWLKEGRILIIIDR